MTLKEWQDICREMLNNQLTSNSLFHDDEEAKKHREQIYVPLALVERKKLEKQKKPDQKEDELSPEQGTKLFEPQYEEKQRFDHDTFLKDILRQGRGKTKGKRIALIGEPGAGKTTLLQTIGSWILEQELGLPVWVSLANLTLGGNLRSFEDYLLNSWLPFSPDKRQKVQDNFTEQFKDGRVWLLLDGVDEIPTSSTQALQNIYRQLWGWVSKAQVVLTCRLNVWQADVNALSDFETFRLLDFDYPQQVNQFIDNWFDLPLPLLERFDPSSLEKGENNSGGKNSKGERLKAELGKEKKARVRDVVQNPLRLALLCRSWQLYEGSLPETKAELYGQFVEQFYRWKSDRFPIEKGKRRKLNLALGELAKQDIDSSGGRFRLRQDFIERILGDADDESSLFYLALRTGWLNNVGVAAESPTKKVYAFFHATFEEYFAALAIDDWDFFLPRNHGKWGNYPVKNKYYRVFDNRWKEVILLWLGRNDLHDVEKDEFIKKLVYFHDGNYYNLYGFHTLFLAAVGITEFKKCRLSDHIVAILVDFALDRFYFHNARLVFGGRVENMDIYWSKMRISSIAEKLLVQTIKEKVIATLIEIIKITTEADFCNKAIQCLQEIPLNNEINALLELLEDSENPSIRNGIVKCLAQIKSKNKKAIAILKTLLETTTDKKNCRDLAYSLGKIDHGNEIAIKEIIWNTYTSESHFLTNSEMTIIPTGNTIAIRELTALLETTTDTEKRHNLAYCLGKIDHGNKLAIEALSNLLETTTKESLIHLDFDNNFKDFEDIVDYISWAEDLGEIDPGNQLAITTLANLLKLPKRSTDISMFAARGLTRIKPDNELLFQYSINIFRLLESSIDEGTPRDFTYFIKNAKNFEDLFQRCHYAAEILSQMSTANKAVAIEVLMELLENHKNDEVISFTIGCSLFYSFSSSIFSPLIMTAYGDKLTIKVLTRLLKTTTGILNRAMFAVCLETINPGNKLAITMSITLLKKVKNKPFFRKTLLLISSYRFPYNKQVVNQLIWEYELIATLKNNESQYGFDVLSEMLWQTTQKLSYPSFYYLWLKNYYLRLIYMIYECLINNYECLINNIYKIVNIVVIPLKKMANNLSKSVKKN